MANITSPQGITFVNQQLRPFCDRMESAIRTARQLKANYAADGLGQVFNPNSTVNAETVDDGAATDGRTVLNGYNVDNAVSQAIALLNWLDANPAVESAFVMPSVNTAPAF